MGRSRAGGVEAQGESKPKSKMLRLPRPKPRRKAWLPGKSAKKLVGLKIGAIADRRGPRLEQRHRRARAGRTRAARHGHRRRRRAPRSRSARRGAERTFFAREQAARSRASGSASRATASASASSRSAASTTRSSSRTRSASAPRRRCRSRSRRRCSTTSVLGETRRRRRAAASPRPARRRLPRARRALRRCVQEGRHHSSSGIDLEAFALLRALGEPPADARRARRSSSRLDRPRPHDLRRLRRPRLRVHARPRVGRLGR